MVVHDLRIPLLQARIVAESEAKAKAVIGIGLRGPRRFSLPLDGTAMSLARSVGRIRGAEGTRMLRGLAFAVGGFGLAAVLTYALLVFGTLLVWQVTDVHDQDGGGAMMLGLVVGPVAAVIGGAVGAVLALIWARSGGADAPPGSEAGKSRDRRLLAIIAGAVAGGIAGHLLARLGFWIAAFLGLYGYGMMRAHTWVPSVMILFGAVAGALFLRRRGRSL
jgi:hypothetical protein